VHEIESTQGIRIRIPLIADPERRVAEIYDMVHPNTTDNSPVRTLFVIDPDKKVRLTMTYPPSTGRNFTEVLRAIDSLKLTSEHQVATPANWERGDDVIVLPSVSDEEAGQRYACGWRVEQSALRYVKDPTLR
jgi:alkyl hydroperoxide reductase subunit AhpC